MARRRRRKKRRKKKIKFKFKFKFKGKPLLIFGIIVIGAAFLVTRFAFKDFQRKHSLKRDSRPRVSAPVKKTTPVSRPVVHTPAPYARALHSQARGPKITFVIDDMGHTTEHLNLLSGLGNQVTYAILPFLKHSSFFDEFSYQSGAEVILHLPMESVSGTIPGPGLITSSMSDDAVLELARRELDSLPHAQGANNHMGSKGTSDSRMMRLILGELKRRGLLFLDSRTTPQSVSSNVAGDIGFGKVLRRDVFLDNVDEPGKIREQIRNLAETARKHGYAVGIGHYRENTLEVLNQEIPKLRKDGFDIISLSEMRRMFKK